MNVFFRPSDITTRICTVSNKTKGGSAFGVCPDGEQVFISPKIVDAARVEVGDLLTAYCIDNHRDEDSRDRYAVRWRAIRVTLQERFTPPAEVSLPAPIPAPVAYAVPPVEMTPSQVHARVRELMQQNRAWTAPQLAEEIGCDRQRISHFMHVEHKDGRVAAARIYARGDQEKYSRSYYAKNVELLYDLIDEIVLDD